MVWLLVLIHCPPSSLRAATTGYTGGRSARA